MKPAFALVAALSIASFSSAVAAADDAAATQLGEAATAIIGRVSSDWSYETLRTMLPKNLRNPGRFKKPLETGRKLGTLKSCKGSLEPLAQIPNAVVYKGVCEFERGPAKLFVGFGIGSDDQPVLLGFDIYAVEAGAPAAKSTAAEGGSANPQPAPEAAAKVESTEAAPSAPIDGDAVEPTGPAIGNTQDADN